MNTYSKNNTCVKCKQKGEVIFHQYVNSFSCQLCGFWWDFGVDINKLKKLLSKFDIKSKEWKTIMKISPAQEYEQNNLSPMVEYYNDPDVDYCDDCNAPMVWCICEVTA